MEKKWSKLLLLLHNCTRDLRYQLWSNSKSTLCYFNIPKTENDTTEVMPFL